MSMKKLPFAVNTGIAYMKFNSYLANGTTTQSV